MDRGSLRGGGVAHVVLGHEPRQLHRQDPKTPPSLPPSLNTFGIVNPEGAMRDYLQAGMERATKTMI